MVLTQNWKKEIDEIVAIYIHVPLVLVTWKAKFCSYATRRIHFIGILDYMKHKTRGDLSIDVFNVISLNNC